MTHDDIYKKAYEKYMRDPDWNGISQFHDYLDFARLMQFIDKPDYKLARKYVNQLCKNWAHQKARDKADAVSEQQGKKNESAEGY
jgi:hypothetical protein